MTDYSPQDVGTMADAFDGYAQKGQHPGRENMRHVASALRQSLIRRASDAAEIEQLRAENEHLRAERDRWKNAYADAAGSGPT